MVEQGVQPGIQRGFNLAFYHGPGTWQDAVIRRVTASPYSHVELVWLTRDGWPGAPTLSLSSSPRDGGVRLKAIRFAPDRWDLIPIAWAPADAWARAEQCLGAGYDWPGVLLRHGLRLPLHTRNRWFCSELCAAALGLPTPTAWTPGGLAQHVTSEGGKASR